MVPLVIFWHFCRLTPAEVPVHRDSGDEKLGFSVSFDRERSERENLGVLSSECLRNYKTPKKEIFFIPPLASWGGGLATRLNKISYCTVSFIKRW